jgi:hypothetical protein
LRETGRPVGRPVAKRASPVTGYATADSREASS